MLQRRYHRRPSVRQRQVVIKQCPNRITRKKHKVLKRCLLVCNITCISGIAQRLQLETPILYTRIQEQRDFEQIDRIYCNGEYITLTQISAKRNLPIFIIQYPTVKQFLQPTRTVKTFMEKNRYDADKQCN